MTVLQRIETKNCGPTFVFMGTDTVIGRVKTQTASGGYSPGSLIGTASHAGMNMYAEDSLLLSLLL